MGLLRLLLAISVLMAHARISGIFRGFGGENAVEIFFMISGFYIALILDNSYPNLRLFYFNRILRLYPIYFLVCSLILARHFIFINSTDNLFSYPAVALLIGTIANTTLIGSAWIMFLQWDQGGLQFGPYGDSQIPIHEMLFIPQAWSLGVEIAFYSMAPFICRIRTLKLFLFLFLLIGIRTLTWINGLNYDPWSYRFFPFELPMFILGILLYRIRKSERLRIKLSTTKIYLIALVSYLSFGFVSERIDFARVFQLVYLILVTAIVILFSKKSKLDTKIGELSYPFYLLLVLVLSSYWNLLNMLEQKTPVAIFFGQPTIEVLVILLVTLSMSVILIRIVRPIERYRDKNRAKSLSK